MKAFYTFYEQTIIDSIDLEPYDIKPVDDFTDIHNVYDIFVKENGFMIDRIGLHNAFAEWLQGLPTVLGVPFTYCDILNNYIASGRQKITRYSKGEPTTRDAKLEDIRESQQQRILDEYWNRLSYAFFTLKDNL